MKYDRKKEKDKLKARAKTTYDRGGGGSKVIKAGLPQWSCKEGKHKIDILPFNVGKKHPELSPGDPDYNYELLVHFGVGANEEAFLCPSMFKEDCPICEYRKENADELDDEKKKELRPKQYTLYNIVCYDTPDEQKKGVQLWLVSSFFMQQKLRAIMQDESGEIINFFETDKREGKKIMFERKGSGAGNTSYLGHKFVDRDYDIADKLLDACSPLDEAVIIPKYEEIEKAFYGKKGKGLAGTEVIDDDSGEQDVPSDIVKDIDVTQEQIEEMNRQELKQLIADEDLDIDPTDYNTKDELRAAILGVLFGEAGNSEDQENECPVKGGTFGKSFDQFDDCPDCELFDQCSDEYDEKYKVAKPAGINRRNK